MLDAKDFALDEKRQIAPHRASRGATFILPTALSGFDAFFTDSDVDR